MMDSRHGRPFWTAVIVLVVLSLPATAQAWCDLAHRWVNEKAFGHLPAEMDGFGRWVGIIAAHASDADRRKSTDPLESPRHWIDIDNFPEFSRGELCHDLDSLRAKHGHHMDVYGNGVVPWTVAGVTETLTVVMAEGDWSRAILLAADLGHYVADCHQPLHTTANYDGQLTGNNGVHLRYECEMVDRNLDQLQADSTLAAYVEDPLEHIFATIEGTWRCVDDIMAADDQAGKRSPDHDEEYYQIMWQQTGHFTVRQLSKAARALADLWYTAWVDAGRPDFPPPSSARAIADIHTEPHVYSLVTVQGVVTTGSGVLDKEHTRITMQDKSGRGILIFDHQPRGDIVRGDLVLAEGMVQDYRGTTEIFGPTLTVLERGYVLPDPHVLSTEEANDSRWNNTLVQVRGTVVFTIEDQDWARLHLDDGSGAIVVLIHKSTGIDLIAVHEGAILSVSGVGTYLSEEGSYAILPGYEDQLVWEQQGGEKDSR